ncbi:MAG: hypothetical protein GDA42_08540 [Ekhidna sp.]|nr:hypothetical protein [Ekhidna sp.]
METYSKIEYLFTFQSIILGFVASEFFSGWGHIIQRFKAIKISSNYLIFTFTCFNTIIIYWWDSWNRSTESFAHIADFLAPMGYTIIYYLISTVIFKDIGTKHSYNHLESDFWLRRKTIFILFSTVFVYDLLVSSNYENYLFVIAALLFSLIGAFAKKKIILNISVYILLLMSLAYIPWNYFSEQEMIKASEYSRIEHVTVFISFLYGFVVSQYLGGWANFLGVKNNRQSPMLLLWSIFSFILIIEMWWSTWSERAFASGDILNFNIVLVESFILYLISIFLIPQGEVTRQNFDFKKFFLANKKYIFLSYACFFGYRIFLSFCRDSLLIEKEENLVRLIGVMLSLLAVKFNSRAYHLIFFLIAVTLLVFNVLANWNIE